VAARTLTGRDDAAWLAGAMTATCYGSFAMARLALPDLPLTFFITLAIWSALEQRWILAGAAAGLGLLMKGPIALAIPAIVLVPIWWRERTTTPVRRGPFRSAGVRDLAVAAAVCAIVALPWYVAMTLEHGTAYLQSFLVGDNLERFATDRFNEPRALWFYLPILAGGMMPWSVYLLVPFQSAVRVVRRQRRLTDVEWRLLLWAAVPLLFFTISIGKQPRYVLPLLPPLALLVAHGIIERTRARRGLDGGLYRQAPDRLLQTGSVLAGLVLAVTGGLVWQAQPLFVGVPAWYTVTAAAITATGGLAVIVAAFSRWWRHAPWVLAWAAAAAMPALMIGTLGGGPDETVRQVARAVTEARRAGEPVGVSRVFVRNLVFYTGTRQTDLIDDEQLAAFLRQDGRALVVVPADVLARVEAAGVPAPVRLAEFRYFNEAGLRLRSILWPDPERDVQRVLLVATRP